MKVEKHSTQIMTEIKGQLAPKDSFRALCVVYLPQTIAAFGVLLVGIAAVIAALR
ncbi:hypothetical protein NX774_12240 [Massilia agilis]|uniref:Uncharacterized protein n=1 Tax=Massilia agilis TaxID=1811226 RepID=A0ABT2DBL9_9BURK|nr:hypothetical protein [Massilia agilis]MCS0808690.1 hypothetical protein [Massilia agilis]